MAKKLRCDDLVACKCPVCGKEFFHGPEWVYKDFDGIYCSWGCMRMNEKSLKEQLKKYKYKPVQQLSKEDSTVIAEFKCAEDALEAVHGESIRILRYACLKNATYRGYRWRYKEDDVPKV